jgi:hypothetical protein
MVRRDDETRAANEGGTRRPEPVEAGPAKVAAAAAGRRPAGRRRPRGATALFALALGAAPAAARADDQTAAEAAFVQGKRLMKEGKTAEACASFALSQKLDPQWGTQYNLALCYEQQGKVASAWGLFRELAQRDNNAVRRKDSARRADAIEPRLTKLLVTKRGQTPGLVLTRDGRDITTLIGFEDPIDPGRYRLVATAPGHREHVVEVEVRADRGAVVTVEIPPLERSPAAEPGPTQPGDRHADPGADDPDDADGEPVDGITRGRGRAWAGIGVAGAGGVALGVGLVFGARARARWSEVQALCGPELLCANQADYDRARALVSDTRAAGNASTVLVGAGARAPAARPPARSVAARTIPATPTATAAPGTRRCSTPAGATTSASPGAWSARSAARNRRAAWGWSAPPAPTAAGSLASRIPPARRPWSAPPPAARWAAAARPPPTAAPDGPATCHPARPPAPAATRPTAPATDKPAPPPPTAATASPAPAAPAASRGRTLLLYFFVS